MFPKRYILIKVFRYLRNTFELPRGNQTYFVCLRAKSLRFYKIADVCERSSSVWFDFTDIIKNYKYSWTSLFRTLLIRSSRYFEIKLISLDVHVQSFTIGYFELPLFLTLFRSRWEFQIAGFDCSLLITAVLAGMTLACSRRSDSGERREE